MSPLPEPGGAAPHCLNCGAPLPEPPPAFCPGCGASLQVRPAWLSLVAALGAALLTLAGMCLGGFGACVAVVASAEGGGSLFSVDALWIWACIFGGLACVVAAGFLVWWLMKKPKRKIQP